MKVINLQGGITIEGNSLPRDGVIVITLVNTHTWSRAEGNMLRKQYRQTEKIILP